ncbi:hypothetical protein PF003_g6352 [Phytophthora fragariae]|nr:hypothetical protein PF003_g6352 [Phytophthora fragariae]
MSLLLSSYEGCSASQSLQVSKSLQVEPPWLMPVRWSATSLSFLSVSPWRLSLDKAPE